MLILKGENNERDEPLPSLDDAVRKVNVELQIENRNLQTLVTTLHERHHVMSLDVAELQDKLQAIETTNAELKNRVEDLEYDMTKTRQREEKLDRNLIEALEKLKSYQTTVTNSEEVKCHVDHVSGLTQSKVDDLQRELEEQREMSNCRLAELEKLHHDHKESLKNVERLKMDLKSDTPSHRAVSSEEVKEELVPVVAAAASKEEEVLKKERDEDQEIEKEREKGKSDTDIIRELKAQLKKSQEAQREMKLLLDMYKGVAKEQRDKVQLMAAEKKSRMELEELRQQMKKLQENERKERKKLADEDAQRKIKQLEETIHQLQKSVASQKQEEEALLNEMEVTGQAFEDMQEQNIRLIQQLREKDDANFKLMSERIKSNQIHKLLREEKDMLVEQVATLQREVEAQNQVVRKLEEKERLLQNNLSTVEKELSLRQQAMEMHKRKAIESAQSAADLKLHLEKYHSQLKEAQTTVADKTSSLEQESFKTRRLQEEIVGLRKKVERAKKFELATTADEVLMEEIREYKEQLTCPSCKVKRKDAVLTKCFHVFCFDCLKTRYETRQRKCPKCNAAFGANDFHRLYLSFFYSSKFFNMIYFDGSPFAFSLMECRASNRIQSVMNSQDDGAVALTNMSNEDVNQFDTPPIKVKYINTKFVFKSNKTVVVDLNQSEQLRLLEPNKSKTIISSHENLFNKDRSTTSVITEGDTYITKRRAKRLLSEQNLHGTEHPAVLMHSEYFQDTNSKISKDSPISSSILDIKPRSGRRRWRRESIEPVQLTPESMKPKPSDNIVTPTPVYFTSLSRRKEIVSDLQDKWKNKICESESSQVLLKSSDQQKSLALLRRSKSGQVTGSRKETASLPKSANLRKKPIRGFRDLEQAPANVFGFPVQAGPRPVADEVKIGINTKLSGSFRKQWSKPNPEPEFRGQEPSDVESASEVDTKRSNCSVETTTTVYNASGRAKNEFLMVDNSTLATEDILDSFHTHRISNSKVLNSIPYADVSSRKKLDEKNTSLSTNPIIYMSEMFKTECLHDCGPWKTRNKKLAWPQEVLEEALRTLTDNPSHAKSAAIQTIGRLAAFYPEVAESEQLALVRGLTREINDPRPYVARLALVCLMLLYSRLRFNMIQCLMETFNVLLTVLTTAKCDMLKRDIISALNHLPDLVVPQQAIQVLLTLVQRYSEQIVQQTVSRCILSILERKGSAIVLHAPPTLTELVLVAATHFCVDLDPIVNSNGLKVIHTLQEHPTFDIVFKNHISAETVRMVMSFMKILKKEI
uniref:E3 ubiquitin protein ligase n=1 Tax=Strigamia maritima TaxID=126957 RepID=T1J6Z3_STRMM